MEGFLTIVNSTPIPNLLILVGLFFIFLGLVVKVGAIELPTDQKRTAIFIGLLLLFIGLILNLNLSQNNVKIEGIDFPSSDIKYYPNTSEEQCVNYCKSNQECKFVIVSPTSECWLKRAKGTRVENRSRTFINVRLKE